MPHRPPHLLINESWYFITAHTVGKTPLLSMDEHKSIWLSSFNALQSRFEVNISAWVLLDNHYHFLSYFQNANSIPKFIQQLHGSTSFKLNKFDGIRGREIWYSYWDRCVRDEKDFWTKFNYIHYNPVKHGYAEKPEDWKFSSFNDILEKKGMEWVDDCWARYPVVEYDFER
jgi:putative transposase